MRRPSVPPPFGIILKSPERTHPWRAATLMIDWLTILLYGVCELRKAIEGERIGAHARVDSRLADLRFTK